MVHVLHGSLSGLSNAGNQLWSQDSDAVTDEAEAWDRFGWSLAAGNFDGQGGDDLAIGVPHERTRRISAQGTQLDEMGAVVVLYLVGRSESALG